MRASTHSSTHTHARAEADGEGPHVLQNKNDAKNFKMFEMAYNDRHKF